MKKLTILLSLLLILTGLTGCVKTPEAPTTDPLQDLPTQTTPTTSVEETEPPIVPDLPLLSFSAPVQTIEHHADDGALLLTYSYQDFSLILEDPQIADAIVLDLLNHVDYENSAAKSVLADAKSAYESGGEWSAFAYSSFFAPERFDQDILSLHGTHSLYSGSPRPSTVSVSITYDLLTGRQLSLRDILVPDYSADAMSQLIITTLQGLSEQGKLFSDYAYVVSELFSTNRAVDCWYLSDTGLCFYFAPYEIAPYSSGTIIAEVPYTSLIGLLRDAYFPPESSEFSGTPYLLPFDSADLEQFQQFSEVILEKDGQQYLLYTDGCLQDLRIQLGSRLDDGSFIAEATVFTTPALCSGDGVVIRFGNETADNLLLTYTDCGEVITQILSSLTIEN